MPLVETLPVTPDTDQWSIWSTTARLVVTDPVALPAARRVVDDHLAAVDAACSRFRPDSELSALHRAGGARTEVSPLLADLIAVALVAAQNSDGDVDPTVGSFMDTLGYDRDFDQLPPPIDQLAQSIAPLPPPMDRAPSATVAAIRVHPTPDWRQVRLDGRYLSIPAGVRLDLGATAKAYAADTAAGHVAARLGVGVLLSLGGDIATAGDAPAGGWRVLVRDRPGDPQCTVAVPAGTALATSSTVSRRWANQGQNVHHILNPRTGISAPPVWRTVTAAAARCVDANTATTAALVRGDGAVQWLRRTGLPARLVASDSRVVTIGGWPTPDHADGDADE